MSNNTNTLDTNYDLVDIDTGEVLRPATSEELAASLLAAESDGGRGAIDVDGRTCYVD